MKRITVALLALFAIAAPAAPSNSIQATPVPMLPSPAPPPPPAPPPAPKPAPRPVAILVHKDNPIENVTQDELRQLLKLDRQFWNEKLRVVLIARPATAPEQIVLLKSIYQQDDKALRKFMVGRLYAGQIAALPTVVKSASAAAKLVQASAGAITVVLAVDGMKPGEAGYPLLAAAE
ncbi:MAG: hypothetical protein EXS13_09300 [Planctomycetes bacterium]|nr:hypothetical protein [Planctomycetota bacterium]